MVAEDLPTSDPRGRPWSWESKRAGGARPGHPLLASGLSSCLPDAGRHHTQRLTRLCLGTCSPFCLDCPTHLPACLSECGTGTPRLSEPAAGTPAPCSVGLSADLLHSVALVLRTQSSPGASWRAEVWLRGSSVPLLSAASDSSPACSLPMGGECVSEPGRESECALSPLLASPAACSEAVTFMNGDRARMWSLELLPGKGSHQSPGQPPLPVCPPGCFQVRLGESRASGCGREWGRSLPCVLVSEAGG